MGGCVSVRVYEWEGVSVRVYEWEGVSVCVSV